MLINYLKITLRNMKQQKLFTILNLTGLAIGITCCILLLLYIQFEFSYDTYHKNSDHIYRVIREGKAFTPAPLGPVLVEYLPEVETAARFIKQDKILISYQKNSFLENDFFWADPDLFNVFSIPITRGNPATILNDPYSLVVSEKIVNKYFKDEEPIGKVLLVKSGVEFKITGVFENIPYNSHFDVDFIAPYTTYFELTGNDMTNWFRNFTYTYFIVKEGTNQDHLDEKFVSVIDRYVIDNLPQQVRNEISKPYPRIFFPQPLLKIHLHSQLRQEIGANNDIRYIYLFLSIAFMILLIACINYINLTTARSIKRAKEVGIRKVAGAERRQLVYQFLSESVFITILSLSISFALLQFVLPTFNNFVDRQIHFNPVSNPQIFWGLILMTLIVGLISGGYPALSLSGFKPITVLKGAFSKSTKGLYLRNLLVVTQFSITISLIICTLIIRNQMEFIKNTDVGYRKEQIVTLPVRNKAISREIQSLKSDLLRYPDILSVATSARLPNNIDTFTSADWPGKDPQVRFTINYNTADYDFVDLFYINILEGRNFSRDFPSDMHGAFLINETAVKAAQFESPIGQEFIHWNDEKGIIVGVMKDFHLRSLHHPIEPLYIFLEPDNFSYISIKISSTDIPATVERIKSVFTKYSPDYPFEYSFFDEIFDRAYHSERRMIAIFSSFTLLAVLISCMGLFGLVLYSVENRIKEIGIRKVLGGSVSGILSLLAKEFIKWILISNILAWPIAWYIMNKWLQNFAYRTDIGIINFVIAALLAIIIALMTMSYQSIKAAFSNPVEALRYE